uniref:Uncharacterized protein n=1 Tax=Clastoptera arizonana TaxID=38151 RepID=A0A1B6CV63_9HEMI
MARRRRPTDSNSVVPGHATAPCGNVDGVEMQQQCGICSVLTELFRRIMCIGGSRRGSGDTYYQELDEEENRGAGVTVDTSDAHGVLICMPEPVAVPADVVKPRRLSDSDWVLLETLDTKSSRTACSGRFLTMHKRSDQNMLSVKILYLRFLKGPNLSQRVVWASLHQLVPPQALACK